ncbi:MAG TPA: hypothetical protein VJ951_13925 [Bacteroidales bacterium]|nr:hypothetical protein [Bacteroidales bacterium]
MNSNTGKSGDWEKRTRNKTVTLAIWTTLWVLSVALATYGHELFWGSNDLINVPVILLNFGIGIGMIIANIKHLREMDEMVQKIQLEAMGVSLGMAVVGGVSYTMLDATNVIPFDAEISGLIVLIALSYFISLLINLRRYK